MKDISLDTELLMQPQGTDLHQTHPDYYGEYSVYKLPAYDDVASYKKLQSFVWCSLIQVGIPKNTYYSNNCAAN